MKLPVTLRAYARDARDAFAHAPVEVLMGVALAVTFSFAVRDEGSDWWIRIFVAAVIALPLVFAASVLRARGVLSAAARWGATALALAAAGAYAVWLFDPELESEEWRAAALAAAAWLALLLAPYPGAEADRRRRTWRFDALLLARILGVGLYGAALFAAMAGAVAAVTSLFELRTPAHLYEDLAGAIFFALVPLVVAGGLPVLVAEATESAPLRAVRLAGRYLYAVVLLVYLAILFAYTIKVAATGDLPKNLLSPIVLFAGLAGLLGGLFLEPLQDDPESRGVARLVRFFPALLLPLLPLPIWAVGIRQDQYGWTEFRYLRLLVLCAMAVLAVWGTVRLARRRPPLLSPIPAVLAAALFLGVVGPWSAQAVSRRDQSARLRGALAEAGMTRGGRLVRPLLAPGQTSPKPTTLPAGQYASISGALSYLYDAHGAEVASRALGANVGVYDNGWQAVAALAINAGCRREAAEMYFGSLPAGTPIATTGGTVFLVSTDNRTRGRKHASRTTTLAIEGSTITFNRGGAAPWSARADVAPLARTLAATAAAECQGPIRNVVINPETARVPLLDAQRRPRGELVVTSVTYGRPGSTSKDAMRLERVEGMVIVRE
jgi:hypothetical protein